MTKNKPTTYDSMLIAGLTPSFLEKPLSWWQKNESNIIKKRAINPYLSRNTYSIFKEQRLSQMEFLRILSELGYQKTNGIVAKATFKHLGSVIILYAINQKFPYAIEWRANTVEDIREHPAVEKTEEFTYAAGKTPDPHRLKTGDYVVHIDHGIGIFRTIKDGNYIIEYAPARRGGPPDMLFVPIEQSKRLSMYLGLRTPVTHRLGTSLWQRIKKKAKEDIIQFASELAALYKKRTRIRRTPFLPFPEIENEIWEAFPYEETSDQTQALHDIFNDFSKPEPMERLVAGDVGFGKTEIALRAALRVIANGKQTAMLAPTTILADQHANLFKKRFEKFPIQVERLTRLESKISSRQILEGLRKGTTDLVIGTHRILQKDVVFKNLGLLIIDEEQRFGVRDKELLKERFPSTDILSLTATPIPRTLAFSLSGIRPMSQLKEAPRGRQAPLTHVLPFSEKIIKSALLAEKKRGGQVYYLANRIRHIPDIEKRLGKLVPHMKKGIIHGRLPEKEIVRVMQDFRSGKIDILISTTIIENGLDISSVNTLIVENASLLGLAQAHQLRGRIGRGKEQSCAYFFYPIRSISAIYPLSDVGHPLLGNRNMLTAKAERRLNILEELSYLGAGVEIAKRDLEIRGAGNILGKEQSGVAYKIGWNLYYEMLNEALEATKEES